MLRSSAVVLIVLSIHAPALARDAGARLRSEARRAALSNVNPELLLQDVYVNLLMVRRCYEARRGSLAVFIHDTELARANGEARSTVERIKLVAPAVREELVWRLANMQIAPLSQNKPNCSGALSFLDRNYGSPRNE